MASVAIGRWPRAAAFWAVVIGFTGARAAYVSTQLGDPHDSWLGVFKIWEGGLALFGGLTFGAAGGAS